MNPSPPQRTMPDTKGAGSKPEMQAECGRWEPEAGQSPDPRVSSRAAWQPGSGMADPALLPAMGLRRQRLIN